MADYTQTIYKGDTAGVWAVGHPVSPGSSSLLDLTGYTCRIKAAGATVDRAVTDLNATNTRFLAYLTPTETDLFALGQHLVAIQLENLLLVPPFRKEVHVELTVKEQGV